FLPQHTSASETSPLSLHDALPILYELPRRRLYRVLVASPVSRGPWAPVSGPCAPAPAPAPALAAAEASPATMSVFSSVPVSSARWAWAFFAIFVNGWW